MKTLLTVSVDVEKKEFLKNNGIRPSKFVNDAIAREIIERSDRHTVPREQHTQPN